MFPTIFEPSLFQAAGRIYIFRSVRPEFESTARRRDRSTGWGSDDEPLLTRGYGWNQQLREAVTLLHTALSSYGLSYGRPAEDATSTVMVANSRRDEGKVWWSQRDLNPCLSLERAPS